MAPAAIENDLVNSELTSCSCNTHHHAALPLQRHFRVLTKFIHVESRLSGRQRPTEAVFYAPINLCDRSACSASVAVGLSFSKSVSSAADAIVATRARHTTNMVIFIRFPFITESLPKHWHAVPSPALTLYTCKGNMLSCSTIY